jgi:hypothetical protein
VSDRLDAFLDPRYLTFADPQRLDFSVLPLGAAQIAAEIEEVVLDMGHAPRTSSSLTCNMAMPMIEFASSMLP